MKISCADFKAYRLPLKTRLDTSTGTHLIRHGWHLQLTSADGHVGLGDIAPWAGFGGGWSNALGALRRICGSQAALVNTPFITPEQLLQELQLAHSPEVQHGVESAILDLQAQREGLSLSQWLNSNSQLSVPICQLVHTRREAVAAAGSGIQSVKLKVGANAVEHDIARIRAVRDALDPNITIRVDANGAWSLKEAAVVMQELEALKLEWIEQPLAVGDINGLKELRTRFTTPIAIDEGLKNRSDLKRHIRANTLDVAVIKPMFVGGLLTAGEMAREAQAAGLKVVITSALESNVGRMAALHLAASLNSEMAAFGLGTPLVNTPFAGAQVVNGRAHLSSAPGLGLQAATRETLIPNPLQSFAQTSPNHPALIVDNDIYSAGDLASKVNSCAAWLGEQGVQAGDLVAIVGESGTDWVISWHALGHLGAIAAPLSRHLKDKELTQQLHALEPEWVLALSDEAANKLNPAQLSLLKLSTEAPLALSISAHQPCLSDPRALLLTSGSTGTPKSVMLTYSQLFFSAMGSALRLGHQNNDTWLCCLPLNHVGGLSIISRCTWYGTTVELHSNFDAQRVADALDSGRISLISLVPTQLERVLNARKEQPFPSNLRAILLGGAATGEALLNRCRALKVPVAVTWGMTESASQVATTVPGVYEPAGCVGAPLPFAEVSVYNNTLRVSGPIAGSPIITQDCGRLDEQGRIWVDGRRDDVINSGGELIDPSEVEAVLTAHPTVSDAAVVGIPDAQWGERTVAAVVRTTIDNESLRQWCQIHLADFKIPKQFQNIDSIPRTELGKMSRARVREQLLFQMETEK